MKAIINNVEVEGTPEEIAALVSIINLQQPEQSQQYKDYSNYPYTQEENTGTPFYYHFSITSDDDGDVLYNVSTNSISGLSLIGGVIK